MKNTVLLYKEIMSNQWKSVSIYFGINLVLYILQPIQLYLTQEFVIQLKMHNVKILLLYIIFFTIIIGIKGIISLLLRLIQKKIQYNISLKYYRQLYSDVSKCNYLNFNDAYFNTKIEQAKLAIEGKISETIFRISDILGAIVSLCGIGILISRVHIIYLLIMIFMTAIQNIFIWINTVQSVELLRTQNIIKRKYDYFVDLLQERK